VRKAWILFLLVVFMAAVTGLTACAENDDGAPPAADDGPAPVDASAVSLDDFEGLEGTIDIAGGTAHIPVMEAVAQDIMEAHPDIVITVAGGGSGVGAQQVGEGLVDIGNTGRELKAEELETYPDLQSFPFAIDGVAVVVHPDNPATELDFEQLKAIFAGEITNWSEVGGEDTAINLYSRDEASGTREVFWTKAIDEGEIASSANIVSSNGAMKTAVADDAAAIGYMGIGGVDESVAALTVEGMVPSQESALAGEYTITRQLYMNTNGAPEGLVKLFVDFVTGENGKPYVEEAGYIPLD